MLSGSAHRFIGAQSPDDNEVLPATLPPDDPCAACVHATAILASLIAPARNPAACAPL
jgi:hypothetical protein